MSEALERIRSVKREHEASWLALDGVVAVGIGRVEGGGTGLVVSVRSATPALRDRLPETVAGVPVEIREVGEVRAQ